MMNDSAAAAALPRLRRAWLREMGIETVWSGGAATAQAAVPESKDTTARRGEAVSEVEPTSKAEPTAEAASTSEAAAAPAGGPPPAADATPIHEEASRAADAAVAHQAAGTLTASLFREAGGAAPQAARTWLVIADHAELAVPDGAQRDFLANMVRALRLEPAMPDFTPIALEADASAGGVNGEQRHSAHRCTLALAGIAGGRAPDCLLLLGVLPRRVLADDARWGEVRRIAVAGREVPAVALPGLTDISAAAATKLAAWRAMCRLAAAARQ